MSSYRGLPSVGALLNDEGLAESASIAKADGSDTWVHGAAESIQIHGGVGFTWEYDCHLYFKRAKAIEVTYGDPTHHRERVATLLEI